MNLKQVILRTAILGLSALACGFLTASAALLTQQWSLPPTDGAYGKTLWENWTSSVEGPVALILAVGGALLAFPFAMGLLWRTRLQTTVPVTLVATVATAALFGPTGMFAAFLALLAGIVTMVICYFRAGE